MARCKAIYQCSKCGMYLGTDAESVDTGREMEEIFVQQMILHDCPGGGTGKAFFLQLTDENEGGERLMPNRNERIQGFILYRIFYRNRDGEDFIAYIGRTKQPLQTRIRGHLFAKPMHRTISIEQVTRIEYAQLPTEADMNLYEIYYILKEKPPLNVDDKTRDGLTVELPELAWAEFEPPLREKWREELRDIEDERGKMRRRVNDIPQEVRVLRSQLKMGEITAEEYWAKKDALMEEERDIRKKLYR